MKYFTENASNFKDFFNNPLIKRKGFDSFLITCLVFYSPLKVAPSTDYASLAFFSSYDEEAILKVNAKINVKYFTKNSSNFNNFFKHLLIKRGLIIFS